MAPLLLTLLPILAKLPLLAGLLRANPVLLYAGLGQALRPGWLGGWPPLPTIDPNIGFTSQALGRRAALELLAGRMPWWNPYEGVGMPLAGEMQSAALFPPTLLLALRDGQLFEHIGLQIIAGLATYGLLRRLDLARLPAFAGAAAFAFNGVFAWLANAVVNPVAFLPMLLLGIETLARRTRQGSSGGGTWIIIGLAASLYAGFPEVAYLDGLLAAAWTLLRAGGLPGRQGARFLLRIAIAAVAGLLIAAPILCAFLDYLPLAELAGHAADRPPLPPLRPAYLALLPLPYLFGGIFAFPEHADFWSNVGGYCGCALPALGFAGILGRSQRGLRLLLAGWIVVALGLTFGAPGSEWLARLIPGLRVVALARYLPASWLLCLCVLAALALDDLAKHRRAWPIAAGVAVLLAGIGVSLGVLQASGLRFLPDRLSRCFLAGAAGGVVLLLLVLGMPRAARTWRAAGLAAVLVGESVAWFVLPTLFYPRGGAPELQAIGFLRAHLGLQRFATLGPIAPNYGAYFGLAAINHNDLPVPRTWTGYVGRELDPNAVPVIFNGGLRADPNGPSAAEALLSRQAAYAAIGVRYVVTAGQDLPGLPEVFRAPSGTRIYQLDGAAPYFAAPGCQLEVRDRTHLSASCEAPATLVRLEMAMPGWHAWVGDAAVDIVTTGGIFQSVALPAGRSDVVFAFRPPFMRWAYAACVTGAAATLAGLRRARRGAPV